LLPRVVEIRSFMHVGGDARVVHQAHTLVGVGLVVRCGDLLCEAETCRARRRLVVRGGGEFL
jgi:hypothetical protein